MKKSNIILLTILGIIVLGLVIFNPFYIIREGEQAVITWFGKINRTVQDAGIHVKVPFAENVVVFTKKILPWDGNDTELPDADQKFIIVDTTARWIIEDLEAFYTATSAGAAGGSSRLTLNRAQDRLDKIIDTAVTQVISRYSLREAVRSSDYLNKRYDELVVQAEDNERAANRLDLLLVTDDESGIAPISLGRRELSREMLNIAQNDESIKKLGIKLLDIVIRQIKYEDRLTQSVYEKMIAQRNRIASKIRAEGEGEKNAILGRLSQDRDRILSEGQLTADRRIAQADAEAAAIYSRAYSADPEFYSFWIALETYKKTLPNMQTTLSTDMDFFKYLYDPNAR